MNHRRCCLVDRTPVYLWSCHVKSHNGCVQERVRPVATILGGLVLGQCLNFSELYLPSLSKKHHNIYQQNQDTWRATKNHSFPSPMNPYLIFPSPTGPESCWRMILGQLYRWDVLKEFGETWQRGSRRLNLSVYVLGSLFLFLLLLLLLLICCCCCCCCCCCWCWCWCWCWRCCCFAMPAKSNGNINNVGANLFQQ